MSALKDIWVLSEKPEMLAELCAGARFLGSNVTALVIGKEEEAEKASKSGADKVYWLGEITGDRIFEDYTDTIYDLITKENPELFLFGASKRVKLIAGRLAARLRTSVLTDIIELKVEGYDLQAKRLVYGGLAVRTEMSTSQTVLALVGRGVFTAPKDYGFQGNIYRISSDKVESSVKWLEKRVKSGESVDLAAAKKVIGVGRGLKRQEDLQLIYDLAKTLNAEVACSRPLAEGLNWLPRERYIGVSGAVIKPDLYFAIGISGQVQHMVGVNQARTIVAINSDKTAPIFAQADYGLVGDLYKVLPLLIEMCSEAK